MSHTYLATKNEDSVDVGKDAMKAEVNVRTYQRKNWRKDTGTRLELYDKNIHMLVTWNLFFILNYSIIIDNKRKKQIFKT